MDVFVFDFLMLFALQKTLFLQEQIRWAVLELTELLAIPLGKTPKSQSLAEFWGPTVLRALRSQQGLGAL